MHFDLPKRMCMYQSLSLSLSLSIYICKNGLDPDQTRMEFRKECFINIKISACDRKYAKCRTKADAHDNMGFQYISISLYIVRSHARIQRGAGGPDPPPPWKITKIKKFLSNRNTGPDPLKFSKLTSWAIIGTPAKRHLKVFRWQADDGPLLVIFGSSPLKKRRKKRCQSSDPDQIQMEFRKECFVNLNIWACKASILLNIRLCRAKADAHEKHLQVSFSAPIHDIFRDYRRFFQDYKRFVCKRFSLSLSPALDPEDLRRLAKPNQGQIGIPRINHVSGPWKNIIELWHEISNNVVCGTSKDWDQPAHMHSLIRAFASRWNILWVLSYWLNIVWSL